MIRAGIAAQLRLEEVDPYHVHGEEKRERQEARAVDAGHTPYDKSDGKNGPGQGINGGRMRGGEALPDSALPASPTASGKKVTTDRLIRPLLFVVGHGKRGTGMSTTGVDAFIHRLARGLAAEGLAGQSDRQLVERLLASAEEVVFEALVRRHGSMVYRVCWRTLQQAEDTEDAFQATFLLLAQKLGTLRKHESLASWLHGVAHRVALDARNRDARRRRHEARANGPSPAPPDEANWREVRAVLDAELAALPENQRLPLILCYLEARTQNEAARQLLRLVRVRHWPDGNQLLLKIVAPAKEKGLITGQRGVGWVVLDTATGKVTPVADVPLGQRRGPELLLVSRRQADRVRLVGRWPRANRGSGRQGNRIASRGL